MTITRRLSSTDLLSARGATPLHPLRGLAFFAVASVLLVAFGVDLVGVVAGETPTP